MSSTKTASPRKPPSPSMLTFCAAVNRIGRRSGPMWRDVKPRQIEDWLQGRLIAQPLRPGRGWGLGRPAVYDARIVLEAVEVSRLMRRHSADEVRLIQFSHGSEIERIGAEYIKHAYLNRLSRFAVEIESTEPPASGDLRTLAEWSEPVLTQRVTRSARTRKLRSRIRDQGEQPKSHIESAVGEAVATFIGVSPSQHDDPGVARLLGLTEDRSPQQLYESITWARTNLLPLAAQWKLEEVVRDTTAYNLRRAREIRLFYRTLSAGPVRDVLLADASPFLYEADERARSLGDDLSAADEILVFLTLMRHELIPRRR